MSTSLKGIIIVLNLLANAVFSLQKLVLGRLTFRAISNFVVSDTGTSLYGTVASAPTALSWLSLRCQRMPELGIIILSFGFYAALWPSKGP
ncbi:hypothetical protein CEXT_368221 [Caerostris extrusa]|uniref:Uncharacterized protein n=1 Tax=Caerostris extrusa TaxID=172846 RepID=A0AAV4V796_CAEEX|nr:hypothetical protein CEXT_368221 [Caerostris extrusa]